jgi:hypothetical protein
MNTIYCAETLYCYMKDYIESIKIIITHKLILFSNVNSINITDDKNYIFIQSIPDIICRNIMPEQKNIYLINTEQMKPSWILDMKLRKYPENVTMIDYIDSNLKYYESKYKKYMLPYQVNDNEIYNITKTKSICIIGDNNIPPRRQHIIDELKKRDIPVTIVSGFNKQRDYDVFQHKVLLNIGYTDEYNKMESIRCDRCIYNKMIVISDNKEDSDNYYLKEHIIFEEYQNIANKVVDILNNYDEYYNKLFESFNINDIKQKIHVLSSDIVNQLKYCSI